MQRSGKSIKWIQSENNSRHLVETILDGPQEGWFRNYHRNLIQRLQKLINQHHIQ